MEVITIVATGRDGAIGKDGNLIWRLPDDLKRFKAITTGHTVVMGRKTWESLPRKPLPGRRNIVVSSRSADNFPGAEVASSPEEALRMAAGDGQVFVMGGEQIYKAMEPLSDKIFLTLVDAELPEADAWFNIDLRKWLPQEESEWTQNSEGVPFKYVTLVRKDDK